MIWLHDYLKSEYGTAYKKISIDAGFTCPNRDGTIGNGGCIFCSQRGSGDFSLGSDFSVDSQIELSKKNCDENEKYIAYFQAFTNTYGDIEKMRKMYIRTAHREDIAIISIATRPDCLGDEVIELIKEINAIKPVWIELGLQTIHEKTASYIRRGYKLTVYENAVKRLSKAGIDQIITHVILGLPGEDREMMLRTVRYVGEVAKEAAITRINCRFGVKLQLLHIIENTDIAKDYREGQFKCLSFDEYVDIVSTCLKMLPDDMIVHRVTGDGDKQNLIAPLWSSDKKKVLNAIRQRMSDTQNNDNSDCTVYSTPSNEYEICTYEKITCDGDINIFLYGTADNVPGDARRLYDEAIEPADGNNVLISYKVGDWNRDFSPWAVEDITGNGPFEGGAGKTKLFLKDVLIPSVMEKYAGRRVRIYLVGYSLAGLFSLWAYYEMRPFVAGAISCSGSLWFPGYEEYLKKYYPETTSHECRYDMMYLSLGGKESAVDNEIMSRVGEITKYQFELAKKDPDIAKCRFDINKGGHFADSIKRISKGITWCMSLNH